MKRLRCLPLLLALVLPLWAQPADLGQIDFPNAGAAAAQPAFLQGVLLLHSFEFEDAAEAFRAAQAADPNFAMAYWGEAMTYNHPLWAQQDEEAAHAALARLGATPEARAAKAPTAREKAYLEALETLYGAGDKHDRDDAYAEAMRRLHEAYPADLEATAFYALALLGTSHEGRDFRTYMKAAALADQVFTANPNHPGAAHYLIHSFDDPVHAPLGLPAARAYAEIAPAATHALHMPSHIFLSLGMWDEVVRMNERSWAASDERAQRKGLGVDQRSFHALWWLAYGYLQQGRYAVAREMLAIAEADAAATGSGGVRTHLARMRAAHLVGTRVWEADVVEMAIDLDGLSRTTKAQHHFATGLAALGMGTRDRAEAAQMALDALRGETGDEGYGQTDHIVDVLAHELEAALALDAGDAEAATAHIEAAVAAEDAMPLDYGPPDVVKPAHEMYGDMLLALDQPAAAQAQYQKALDRTPRRALALLGLARAATRAGDAETATHAYADLRALWHHADADLPEREEVMPNADAMGGR